MTRGATKEADAAALAQDGQDASASLARAVQNAGSLEEARALGLAADAARAALEDLARRRLVLELEGVYASAKHVTGILLISGAGGTGPGALGCVALCSIKKENDFVLHPGMGPALAAKFEGKAPDSLHFKGRELACIHAQAAATEAFEACARDAPRVFQALMDRSGGALAVETARADAVSLCRQLGMPELGASIEASRIAPRPRSSKTPAPPASRRGL